VVDVVSGSPDPEFAGGLADDPHDVATVTLGNDVPVRPLGLVTAMDQSWQGRTVLVVGYGKTDPALASDDRKRQGRMRVEDLEPGLLYLKPDAASACEGDSGGPVLYEDSGHLRVAGVVTFGDLDCKVESGAVRVDDLLYVIDPDGSITHGTGDPCGDLTEAGTCEGDTASFCHNDGTMHSLDCAGFDWQCGFDNGKNALCRPADSGCSLGVTGAALPGSPWFPGLPLACLVLRALRRRAGRAA
jgi:hypothetical protein